MEALNMDYTLLISLPGGSEWILILVVVLLIFGGKKIPELMRGIGKGVREFKDAKDSIKTNTENEIRKQGIKDNAASADTSKTIPPAPPVE